MYSSEDFERLFIHNSGEPIQGASIQTLYGGTTSFIICLKIGRLYYLFIRTIIIETIQ